MKKINVIASVLKVIVGALFIISSVSKFITIDSFEIYVYSFGFFSLSVSFFVARLLLAVELVLGTALISHRHHRFTTLMAILSLLGFIVFLAYAHLIGRTDSCHCFGDLLPFSPVQSIVKNAVITIVLLFVYKYSPTEWAPSWKLILPIYLVLGSAIVAYMVYAMRVLDYYAIILVLVAMAVGLLASFRFYRHWLVTTLLIAAPFVAVFILTPPDNWFYNDEGSSFDKELLLQQISPDGAVAAADTTASNTVAPDSVVADTVMSPALSDLGLSQGRHLLAFFSPSCGYCQLAAGKITTIVERIGTGEERITYVFPNVRDKGKVEKFYENSRSAHFGEVYIGRDLFLKITKASFPLVVLIDDGQVVASYEYRNIDDKILGNFLSEKPVDI